MRRVIAISCALLGGCGDDLPGFTPLFDGESLDGWYTYLPSQGRGADPHGVFAVDGGTLHILGSDVAPADFEFGYLATVEEFGSFRLRFEYRWGTRKYVDFARDSGVFFAMVGPDAIWPRSIECQVMENDTGSLYAFDFATVETTIDPAIADPTYRDGGVPYTTPRQQAPFPRVTRGAAADSPTDWNSVEIHVDGEASEYIVNGITTFRSSRRTQPDPDAPDDPSRDRALLRGRIVIQEEGAEVIYRNLEVERLDQ